jgi:hypothetical protein
MRQGRHPPSSTYWLAVGSAQLVNENVRDVVHAGQVAFELPEEEQLGQQLAVAVPCFAFGQQDSTASPATAT